MSTVVVFGATGYAGQAISAELAGRGHIVTGVARHAEPGGASDNPRLVAGSLHDEDFVAQLVAGADVVIVSLPARPLDGRQLIDAVPGLLKSAAGARVGFVGGAASLRVSEDGPILLETPEFPAEFYTEASDHKAVLDLLRTTPEPADWFYVSPAATFGSFNPGPRTGAYRVGGDVLLADEDGNSWLSAGDLAVAFADEIERPAHRRQRFTVAY